MRRGEIWLAYLNPPRGREIGKMRPVLRVQSDELLAIDTPLVVVLPLTTQLRPGMSAWCVHFAKRQRLLQDSQIVIDQPRALDRERLIDGPLAEANSQEMEAVDRSLAAVLGLPFKPIRDA